MPFAVIYLSSTTASSSSSPSSLFSFVDANALRKSQAGIHWTKHQASIHWGKKSKQKLIQKKKQASIQAFIEKEAYKHSSIHWKRSIQAFKHSLRRTQARIQAFIEKEAYKHSSILWEKKQRFVGCVVRSCITAIKKILQFSHCMLLQVCFSKFHLLCCCGCTPVLQAHKTPSW